MEVVRLLCVTQYFVPELGQHWLAPSFLCRVKSGKERVHSPTEVEDVRWFELDELPSPLMQTACAAVEAYAGGRPRTVPTPSVEAVDEPLEPTDGRELS